MSAAEKPWEVRAETHEGARVCLRRFATQEEAEAHPVKLASWRRVWVHKTMPVPAPAEATLRPPWDVEEPAGTSFTYLRDADGTRIASLFGTHSQRRRVIGALRAAGLLEPSP